MSAPQPEPLYSSRIDDALAFVAATFRHVTRKDGGTPYLWHLLAVASMVGEAGGGEDQVVAALLHDYLEDVEGGSSELVASRYGPQVASLVEVLTDTTERPKPPWRQRKEQHIVRMRTAPAEAKLIAVCDKLHNARATLRDIRAIGPAVWARFNAPPEQTLWYYHSMGQALATGFSHPLLDELDSVIRDLHAAAGLPMAT